MKNYLLILALLIVGCGNRHSQQVATTQSIETGATDSTAEHVTEEPDIEILPDSMNIVGGKSLNDIRFGNWTDKDWLDNDYFRTLRKYDYLSSVVSDWTMEVYNQYSSTDIYDDFRSGDCDFVGNIHEDNLREDLSAT